MIFFYFDYQLVMNSKTSVINLRNYKYLYYYLQKIWILSKKIIYKNSIISIITGKLYNIKYKCQN